ncbi:hypothetical protein RYZ20_08000 [Thioclava sp. A2]|uniref:DUF7220 family protein n=1 Tax=Thioclava sp. FCG-A2 TaxID=3080562 RepID=UPI0029549793|nr:hypothetical protein [Thioclava sp. A2]MDV7270843.1 hypothetical protein [Thioclava sp. A2]
MALASRQAIDSPSIPIFGLHTTLAQNLQMGLLFTCVSLARSFLLRRLFEAIRVRGVR